MFGIGGTELLLILVVALLVLGPKSVPQIARTLGKALGEFRRVSTDFQRTLNTEVELEEHEKRKKEAESELFAKTENTIDEKPTISHDAISRDEVILEPSADTTVIADDTKKPFSENIKDEKASV